MMIADTIICLQVQISSWDKFYISACLDICIYLIHICVMYVLCKAVCMNISQFNNIDFSSEVSTVNKFAYTDEALLLVRQ